MKDITGNRYGTLLVLSCTGEKTKNRTFIWNCLCDCGKECKVSRSSLLSGNTKSCGCGQLTAHVTHGKSNIKSKVYKAWSAMKNRCTNPNYMHYEQYGGSGISFDPIFEDFSAFYAEIGEPPSEKHSLDRIDNSKGYIPGNIRWATPAQQAQNRGMYRCNKTGVTGVRVVSNARNYISVQASWRFNGKIYIRSFAVSKYGYDEAFRLACITREAAIKYMNDTGANYTENHGKAGY